MPAGRGDFGEMPGYGQDFEIKGVNFTVIKTEYPSDKITVLCPKGCEKGMELHVDEGVGMKLLRKLKEEAEVRDISSPIALYALLKEIDFLYEL